MSRQKALCRSPSKTLTHNSATFDLFMLKFSVNANLNVLYVIAKKLRGLAKGPCYVPAGDLRVYQRNFVRSTLHRSPMCHPRLLRIPIA